MRKINFKLEEKSKANTIHLLLKFAGGDADTEHDQEHHFKFPYSEWEENVDEIKKEFDFYKILQTQLDIYKQDTSNGYDAIEKEFGEEMALSFDNCPNDPQCDYQFKCYLDDIVLIGYDEECNRYESYL